MTVIENERNEYWHGKSIAVESHDGWDLRNEGDGWWLWGRWVDGRWYADPEGERMLRDGDSSDQRGLGPWLHRDSDTPCRPISAFDKLLRDWRKGHPFFSSLGWDESKIIAAKRDDGLTERLRMGLVNLLERAGADDDLMKQLQRLLPMVGIARVTQSDN